MEHMWLPGDPCSFKSFVEGLWGNRAFFLLCLPVMRWGLRIGSCISRFPVSFLDTFGAGERQRRLLVGIKEGEGLKLLKSDVNSMKAQYPKRIRTSLAKKQKI